MIESKDTADSADRAIKGIDEKVHDEIQYLEGAYPEFVGLQKRFGGKTILDKRDRAIHGIYVFYNYYGRRFNILEFDDGFEITEPPKPPVVPLSFVVWSEDFEEYADGYTFGFYNLGDWQVGNTVGFITYFLSRLSDNMESYAAGNIAALSMGFIDTSIYALGRMEWRGAWHETIVL